MNESCRNSTVLEVYVLMGPKLKYTEFFWGMKVQFFLVSHLLFICSKIPRLFNLWFVCKTFAGSMMLQIS
jgi:hypothetical protein